MINAKRYSVNQNYITLYSTQFEEDVEIIPHDFIQLSNLKRSVLDVNPSLQGKKLPLIKDVLDKLNEVDADYYIYTNVDIALQPYFYDAVFEYIQMGHDAIVINRRRLSRSYQDVKELPMMYADLGKSHPGFDCFVFHKSLLDKLILENICIGIPFVEVTLVHNLFSLAKNPLYVPDAHLTFHIGMEVMPSRNKALYWHNRNEFFLHIYPQLKKHFRLDRFPYAALPLPRRALKWMLNPSLFTLTYLELEKQSLLQKAKVVIDELRWRILQR